MIDRVANVVFTETGVSGERHGCSRNANQRTFGVLEDCDKLELEGQMVECWVEEEEGFELATGEVERVL
ncbi:hypothetical protein JCM19240_2209 [Vibrio maritimus]|uniref:Uncharacterized protein n=1 Tax=Vibrio maritimus TaxID=990268 RepID=A0A090T2Y3_9VIBR|nr:hypothetical protein JCM19240_2209 [Vibrio maritimus]